MKALITGTYHYRCQSYYAHKQLVKAPIELLNKSLRTSKQQEKHQGNKKSFKQQEKENTRAKMYRIGGWYKTCRGNRLTTRDRTPATEESNPTRIYSAPDKHRSGIMKNYRDAKLRMAKKQTGGAGQSIHIFTL